MKPTMLQSPYQKPGERLEALGLGELVILQDPTSFRFSIDAVLLAWFAADKINRKTRLIDLGAGTGILSLLLYGRKSVERIKAIELQPKMANMARRSVLTNKLEDHIEIICGDLRNPNTYFHSSSYDAIVCNPPYMPVERGMVNPKDTLALSRHEITCTLDDVVRFSKKTLKDHGRIFLVHRADRIADITVSLRNEGLEPKRILPVHPYRGKPANLILVEAMKKGRPQCKMESPIFVYDDDGKYTDTINAIYNKSNQPKMSQSNSKDKT